MLGDGKFFSCGIDILWSVNLLRDGPGVIEFGRVKTSVMIAKPAIVRSRDAIRRGDIRGIGRPKRRLWTGIVQTARGKMMQDLPRQKGRSFRQWKRGYSVLINVSLP